MKRWQLHAVDLEGGVPGLAAMFNANPQRFFFRRSAKDAVRFFESRVYIPCRFYIVPVNGDRESWDHWMERS